MTKKNNKKRNCNFFFLSDLGLVGGNLLDLADGLVEDLGLELGVQEIGLDLLDHVSGQLGLLALTDGGLVADPGVEDRLDLGGHGGLLLELKGLSLELGGLLGKSVEGLGDLDNILHLTDLVNAVLNGGLVVDAGLLEDGADLVDVDISPLVEGLAGSLDDTAEGGSESQEDQGLLVEDVDLLGDQVGGSASNGGDVSSLGDQRVTGEGVNDALGLGLGGDLLLCCFFFVCYWMEIGGLEDCIERGEDFENDSYQYPN